MWTMWDAPSDRDYYGQFDDPRDEPPDWDPCVICGAPAPLDNGVCWSCEDTATQLAEQQCE